MKRSKKEDLFLLSLETVNRKVDEHNVYLEATGTAESIQAWGKESFGNDADQQRALKVIISNFVLQFHYEAEEIEVDGELHAFTEDAQPPGSTRYISERVKQRRLNSHVDDLKRLSGLKPGNKQLICFLTGAGGSGKSQVLNAVKSYGKTSVRTLAQHLQNGQLSSQHLPVPLPLPLAARQLTVHADFSRTMTTWRMRQSNGQTLTLLSLMKFHLPPKRP
jgi:hypothetical protein